MVKFMRRWFKELVDMETVATSQYAVVGFSKHYYYLVHLSGVVHLRRKPKNEFIYQQWIENTLPLEMPMQWSEDGGL